MTTFRLWFENQEQKMDQIREVWNNIFKALSGGIGKKDALTYSLEKVTDGSNDKTSSGTAIIRKLNQFFPQLLEIDKAYFEQKIDDAQKWLGQNRDDDDEATAPHRTVRGLMEKLFGTDEQNPQYGNLYAKLSGEKEIEPETLKAPPQPPADQPPQPEQPQPGAPDQPEPPPDQQPQPEQPGQQPQVPPQMPMAPNAGMPTPPPLYKMGVY